MTSKEFIGQYQINIKMIEDLTTKIERYGDHPLHNLQQLSEYKNRIEQLYNHNCNVSNIIMSLDDCRYRYLLILRYIDNIKDWEIIAEKMCYSSEHIRKRLHPQALIAIGRKMNIINMSL